MIGSGEICARVFAANCTGSAALSADIGRPLCLIDVSLGPDRAIARLNAKRHGCGVRWPGSFQHLKLESGWDDWRTVDLDGRSDMLGGPPGVTFEAGGISVLLPPSLALAEFREHLAGSLRHLRLQEVTISAAYIEERCDMFAEMVVHPRYTPARAAQEDFRDAVVCDDLYLVDPARHAQRILWCAVAARAAAGEGRSLWR